MSTRSQRQYGSLAAFAAAGLVAAALTITREQPPAPESAGPLARWLQQRPADWQGFSTLSGVVLDSDLARRVDVWRMAYAHASGLAPQRPQPRAAFVRAGLFHWIELSEGDRRAVKDATAPLLRDPDFFYRTHALLYGATEDFDFIARNRPPTLQATRAMKDLAVESGRFDEYRRFRAEEVTLLLKQVEQYAGVDRTADLLASVPNPLVHEHLPLVKRIIQILESAPIPPSADRAAVTRLIEFALEHNLKPLGGLAPAVADPHGASAPARARLALALGDLDAAAGIRLGDSQSAATWRTYHVERALLLARKGDFEAADVELVRAAEGDLDPLVLSAVAEVARMRDDQALARQATQRLAAIAQKEPEWAPLCSGVICGTASALVFRDREDSLALRLAGADGREVVPYVEISVDGVIVAEGPADGRTFDVPVPAGLHRVAVKAVSTRETGQRRVTLS